MINIWALVRFLHILGATLWVGGQLTLLIVVLPPVHRALGMDMRTIVMRRINRRFGLVTGALFLPNQLVTGTLLAAHEGVRWSSLTDSAYGRILAVKLGFFALVMIGAVIYGVAETRRNYRTAEVAAMVTLLVTLGVVFMATGLTEVGHG
jgi:uncharacterized membrane protein